MSTPILERLVDDMRDTEEDESYWGELRPTLLEIVACSLADRAMNANPHVREVWNEMLARIGASHPERGEIEGLMLEFMADACKLGALVGVQVARHLDVEGTYAAVARITEQAITVRTQAVTASTGVVASATCATPARTHAGEAVTNALR